MQAMLQKVYHNTAPPSDTVAHEDHAEEEAVDEEHSDSESEAGDSDAALALRPRAHGHGSIAECREALQDIVYQQHALLAQWTSRHAEKRERRLKKYAKRVDGLDALFHALEEHLRAVRAEWDRFHTRTARALAFNERDDSAVLSRLNEIQAELVETVHALDALAQGGAPPAPAPKKKAPPPPQKKKAPSSSEAEEEEEAPRPAPAKPKPAPAKPAKPAKPVQAEPPRRSARLAATGAPFAVPDLEEEEDGPAREEEDTPPPLRRSDDEILGDMRRLLRGIIDEITADEAPTHAKLDELCMCLPAVSHVIDLSGMPSERSDPDAEQRQCQLASFLTAQLAQLCNHNSAPPSMLTSMRSRGIAHQLLLGTPE